MTNNLPTIIATRAGGRLARLRAALVLLGAGALLGACVMPPPVAHTITTEQTTSQTSVVPPASTVTNTQVQQSP